MSDPGPKSYRGSDITVTFDAGRCRHAAECVRGLPEVFDVSARPWITPDNAGADAVAEVVARCPSGALQYIRATPPA
ncbi:putative Fe-S cluster protein YjdI [Catenuloplanes nepalensis]|uniref:Fe-S cluster protein YjdI n=1 Tax=Catenuloplanes nepalensis TaxID=587533 RepID=A0ABT9MXJ8_9ACTN|nr:(4Fe-4S)-binding protein [Catenuloplanes nepalensis]MDP9796110.1 putative Fe-S cluster protein YjdI [Catenuloplanes nepalensis]